MLCEPMVNREQMRQTVFGYIEVDYNRTRRHSTLGYLSPEKYEQTEVAQSVTIFTTSDHL